MKNIFASWRKIILKILIWKIFNFFFPKNQKIKISKFPNFEIRNLKITKFENSKFRNFEILIFDFPKTYFLIFFKIKNFKIFFSMMKKYFSSNFFLNIKSYLSAFQRTQLELQGVSESDGAHISIHRTPPTHPPRHPITLFTVRLYLSRIM